MNNPCYKCETRSAECHSVCKKYREWKAQSEKKRLEAIKRRDFEASYTSYKINLKRKASKKH